MNKFSKVIAVGIVCAFSFGATSGIVLADGSAHSHIGHVLDRFEDTPSNRGLLQTAMKEAIAAGAHAKLTAKASNLSGKKLHAGHVRHAIKPELESSGPGLGYGLLKAANGVIEHITLASESDDASENVKIHAVHVVSAMTTVIERTELALAEADEIKAASSDEEAAIHAEKMFDLTDGAIFGRDLDGDGEVSWENGEGGLKAAEKHMKLLADGEGL